MGLTRVADIPRDAEHVPEQDTRLPSGATVQQFRQERSENGIAYDVIYERITHKGSTRTYRLDPDEG